MSSAEPAQPTPPSRGSLVRALHAFPGLLRVGLAEVVAYRAEFLVWILTTNMPLVMMGLWSAVASEGPVGRFGQRQFVAYYLAALVIRLLTSSWLVWEMTMEIRQGALAPRLLRPLHPLLAYAAHHLAAVPMRALVVSPALIGVFIAARGAGGLRDPVLALVLIAALLGAWILLFATMVMIGALALFVESALSVFDLWLGVQFVLSGYLVPLELLPPRLASLAQHLPFRFTLAFPVEVLVGLVTRGQALRDLAVEWLWVAVFACGAAVVWRAGMRRFVAFGG